MEPAWILLLLCSAPLLCVRGTPISLSSFTPTQDSDLETTAASTLNIDSTSPGLDDEKWNKKKEIKMIRQVPNTKATTESENISEDESAETWLSPLDSEGEDVPKQFFSPQVSTEGVTMTTMPDPLVLPAIGPGPKEDGAESLWTEAVRPSGADTMVPLSQDDATESTMSSESLPLIFEPLDDVSPEGALSDPPRPSPSLLSDWTSPRQTSSTELQEPIRSSDDSQEAGSEEEEEQMWTDAVRTSNPEERAQSQSPSITSLQRPATTVTMTTATATTATMTTQHQHRPKSRPGFDEMESEEERDEEEETSEESMEESEEEQTDAPDVSTPPPYSLIPPPPIWVQRNQGLMRSWVELIREKAGYVSGMLAPVGIGISGALLLVGALYSIRTIHRKRRNSFKHQRRKSRQPEQPREPGVSGQDQAMLLADSSEDEF